MPLRVLDGNQSATTLSSVVTGGEHIVAHTVVSLGSTAISNITTAVSGTTVCVGNLGLLQSTVGTEGVSAAGNFIKIGGHAGTATTGNIVHVSSVGAMRVDGSSFTQPISGSVTISNFPATQTIAGTVTANGGNFLNSQNALITNDSANNLVLLGGLSYSSTPTQSAIDALRTDGNGQIRVYQQQTFWTDTNQGNQPRAASQQTPFPVQVLGGSVTIGSLPAISGTVTANGGDFAGEFGGTAPSKGILVGWNSGGTFVDVNSGSGLPVFLADFNPLEFPVVPASGSSNFPIFGTVTVGNSVTIGSLPAISGTVTANSIFPRVTLIDGSGTVTTANTAITVFASSSTRSYLLVQVTTGSAFVNVGATATTLNGISLTAGQGYAWETTIPQGAVSLISTTTNSAYVAKQA